MVVGTVSRQCDVVVIGGGPGGYAASIRLGQAGRDVVLVEQRPTLGGVCLNEGCIPKKVMSYAADLVAEVASAAAMGLSFGTPSIDVPRLMAWKDRVVGRLTKGVRYLCDKANVEVVQGRATFLGPGTLRVEAENGSHEVSFATAVIATGSVPREYPGFPFDGHRILTPSDALSVREVPKKMVIIGGGYIGLGLASLFAKLGSGVTVIEAQDRFFPYLDPDVGDTLRQHMERQGVAFRLLTRARSWEDGVVLEGLSHEVVPADVVVVAAGRRANTEGLGLEHLGVSTDASGFIRVNNRLETTAPRVYAIGDVIGGPLLAHKAYREAKVVAGVITGEPLALDNVVIPGIVFTDPEVAWVGLPEKDARAAGVETVVGTFPLRASGGALALNAPVGFVKTVADARSKRILGVFAVGRGVTELISKAGLAIEMGALLEDVSSVMEPHPTISEAFLESVEAALGTPLHVPHA